MYSFASNIVFEDDVLLVCHKPFGLMVEPDRNNYPNLLNQAKQYLKLTNKNSQPYVQHLHRIDRVTSGIVLFTKNKNYLRNLSEQFAQRKVQKYYYALTENSPPVPSGIIENWHRKEKKKALIVAPNTPFSDLAKLEYLCSQYKTNVLWNITLHTGKYHQIRAQLANVGCPIIGDNLYGSDKVFKANAIALFAYKLIINHPVDDKLMTFDISKRISLEFE